MAATGNIESLVISDLTTTFSPLHTNLSTLRATATFSWSGFNVSYKPRLSISATLTNVAYTYNYGTVTYQYNIASSSGSATASVDFSLNVGALQEGTNYVLRTGATLYTSDKYSSYISSENENLEFTFYRYNAPSIQTLNAQRCLSDGTIDESGEYISVSASYSISPVNSTNSKLFEIHSKPSLDDEWVLDTSNDLSAYDYSDDVPPFVLSLGYSGSVVYDIKLKITDTSTFAENTKVIPVGVTTAEFDTVNHRVSVGKRVESDGPQFDVAESGRFGGSLEVGGIVNYPLSGLRIALSESDFLSSTSYTPFSGTAVNGGSLTFGYGYTNHPGAVTLRSGSSSPSGYSVSTDTHSIQLDGGEIVHAIFKQSEITTVSYIGFYDSFMLSGSLIEGVHIKLSGSKAYGVTSKYVGSALSSITSQSSYTLLADTWYHAIVKLEIVDSAPVASFILLNESGEVLWSDSLDTNIPILSSTRVCAGIFSKSDSYTNTNLTVLDYLSLSINRDLIR